MDLRNITTTCCPICGCKEIVEEKVDYDNFGIRVHCNKTRWEHRRFLCGTQIDFEPNFNKEYTRGNCKNDPVYQEKLKKEKEDKEKLLNYCKENNIDEKIMHKIKLYII